MTAIRRNWRQTRRQACIWWVLLGKTGIHRLRSETKIKHVNFEFSRNRIYCMALLPFAVTIEVYLAMRGIRATWKSLFSMENEFRKLPFLNRTVQLSRFDATSMPWNLKINSEWVLLIMKCWFARAVGAVIEVARKIIRFIANNVYLYIERINHHSLCLPEPRIRSSWECYPIDGSIDYYFIIFSLSSRLHPSCS